MTTKSVTQPMLSQPHELRKTMSKQSNPNSAVDFVSTLARCVKNDASSLWLAISPSPLLSAHENITSVARVGSVVLPP